MYSLEQITKSYYKNISLDDIGPTKEYNLVKNDNYKDKITKTNTKIEVIELPNIEVKIEEKSFSKKSTHLTTKEEQNKLDYGIQIHELLELIDFNNPNYEKLSSNEKLIVENLLNNIDTNNANIYKEYEFIYSEGNTTYHGIIDLMLEYEDNIKIIDYKLKNIHDVQYINQLTGYKNYIEKIFNKKTNTYLYSILDGVIEKV